MVAHSSFFTLLLSAVSLKTCSAMDLLNANVVAELSGRLGKANGPEQQESAALARSRRRAAKAKGLLTQSRFQELRSILSRNRDIVGKVNIPKPNAPTMAKVEEVHVPSVPIPAPVVEQGGCMEVAYSDGACPQVPLAPVTIPVEPAEEKLEVTTPMHEFAVECTMKVDDEVRYNFFDGREGKVTFGKKIIIAELFASPRHPDVYHASHLSTQGTQTCYYDVNACQATFEIKETVMREEKTFWGGKKMKEGIQVIEYIYKLSDTDTSDEEDFREDFRQACEVYCSENNNVKIQFM